MYLRKAYLSMIKAFAGGWDAIAPALGMTRDALENRIYERKGQGLLVETALQMQAFAGTTHFAEAIATLSGGTFVRLPDIDAVDNDSLFKKFNQLHADIGLLSQKFSDYTSDDELDAVECASLSGIGNDIHRKMEELLTLTFRIYCRDGGTAQNESKRGAD